VLPVTLYTFITLCG